MPSLSIVIPVYNAGGYLEKCLDSVLNQVFTDYELILVNDGSTDASGEVCEAYAARDKRIRVIHQENGGQAAARNRGIEAAKGTYVGFCDNDDLLHPEMFRVLMDQVTEESDVSACSYREKDVEGRSGHCLHNGETYCFTNRKGMEEYLSRERMDIYVWTKIYRRSFLNNYQIRFEKGRNDEDFLFNHEVFRYARLTVFTDRALYTYTVRPESECRVYYKRDLRRYLHNTLYRTYKIETMTREGYPELLPLARRQTIRYHIMMIGRIIRSDYREAEPYFSYVMRYLRRNKDQLIREKRYWGMSLPGIWVLLLLPPRCYYYYRRILERFRKG